MKNSFFLVIPEQNKNPDLLKSFEEIALQQWIMELPTANPGLATRLLYDLLKEFTRQDMDVQKRLDALEMLRPSYLIIEEYLRSRLIKIGFPKGEDEKKIHNVLISIEKEFTIGYWIVARELTKRNTSWFKGKNIALAIQRVMVGLSSIITTNYIMSLVAPDWVWIDLHSLYKLGVKLNKETNKVVDENSLNNSSSIQDCYKQIFLLSLSDPTGLMQKEIQLVYQFTEKISSLLQFSITPFVGEALCVALIDEDQAPFWNTQEKLNSDSALLYLGFEKLNKTFAEKEKFINSSEARFSSVHILKNNVDKLPAELIDYLISRWSGESLAGAPFFSDRLDRYISVGLNSTYDLQSTFQSKTESETEYLTQSSSDRSLCCHFDKLGALSIGSMVSFRKTNLPEHKRSLGIVNKINMSKSDDKVIFELQALTLQSHAVNYLTMDDDPETDPKNALIYGVKTDTGEKSFLIIESFMFKDDDVIRLLMNEDNFPIILRNKKNVGLGYWQFECRQLIESEKQSKPKKGYDFI